MKLFGFFFFFMMIGCAEEVKPKDILEEDEMISILVDVHVSDAFATEKKIKDVSKLNQLKKTYLLQVLDSHNTSLEDYEKSMNYYENHLDEMFALYEKVMNELSAKEAVLNGQK